MTNGNPDFLDHLLRDWPAKRLLAIKRSFYDPTFSGGKALGNAVFAFKGIYQSLRMAQDDGSFGKVVINADVANTCFWPAVEMAVIAVDLVQPCPSQNILSEIQKTVSRPGDKPRDTVTYQNLKRLLKLRFRVDYRGMSPRELALSFDE